MPLPLDSAEAKKQTTPTLNSIPMSGNTLVQIGSARKGQERKNAKQASVTSSVDLILCRGCNRHVFEGTEACPYCLGDIRALAKLHNRNLREARRAYLGLLELLPPERVTG